MRLPDPADRRVPVLGLMSYSRAYGRALSQLRELHRPEFDQLLADHLEGVALEDAEERALPTVGEVLNAPDVADRRAAADERVAAVRGLGFLR